MTKKTPKTPAHADEVLQLDTLTEFPGNPRSHGEKQLEELGRSLTMFGQFRPLVVDEKNVVLAGNGMLTAMRRLGWTEGKAVRITGLDEAGKKKLVLADNRIAGMGYTDFEEVDRILNEINDTQIPGYDEEFLRQMLAEAEEILEVAETYGTFEEDELEYLDRNKGIYEGEHIPQHLQPRKFEDEMEPAPPLLSAPAPRPETLETEPAETVDGGEVQVCIACKRPW